MMGTQGGCQAMVVSNIRLKEAHLPSLGDGLSTIAYGQFTENVVRVSLHSSQRHV